MFESGELKSLLENQADPLKVFKPLSYDEMKDIMDDYEVVVFNVMVNKK